MQATDIQNMQTGSTTASNRLSGADSKSIEDTIVNEQDG